MQRVPLSWTKPSPTMPEARHTYAAWNEDLSEIKGCSSGGAAYLMSRFLIERHGVVYASAFGEDRTVSVHRINTIPALEPTKGSKYVRGSFSGETFDLLKADLEDGREVLFIGTPCQVAGLKKRLGDGIEHLTTIDLLCHGTPQAQYLREEVRHLIGDRPYTDVRFRGGRTGDFHLSIWNQEQCLYSVEARKQPYVLGMLIGVTLMEGCYNCPFATPDRAGDLTLGDYIGLGKEDGFCAPQGHKVSYISINTPRGEFFYSAFLQQNPQFRSVERPAMERQSYRPSLLEPTARHPLRTRFLELLPRLGFARAIRRTLRGEILQRTPLYRTLHHWAHRLKKVYR